MSHADVNGVSLHYEEHGSGEPLVLLHGGLGAGEMFAAIMPALSAGRRVITVDLQAHGGTADVDRPLRPQTMADDVAALIEHLGLPRADVMGYSLGGAGGAAHRDPAPASACAAWSSSRSASGATARTRRSWRAWTASRPRWPTCWRSPRSTRSTRAWRPAWRTGRC